MTALDMAPSYGGSDLGGPGQGVLWMIDNNPADLEIAGIVCEMIGFRGRFVPLGSGTEGIDRLKAVWDRPEERPDVILLDINMPRLSGMAVLRLIRSEPRWAQLPVVMFSTSYNEERTARDAGATDYVVKPALIPETAAAVRRVIARHCKRGSLPADPLSP